MLDRIAREIAACTACPLWARRRNPVAGEGSAKAGVMFVGEAPGAEEDARGRPFVGPAGRLFDELLAAAGLSRDDVYVTSVLKCRPPGNRNPATEEVRACAAHLRGQIEAVKPRIICPMGNFALRSLLGKGPGISRAHGVPQEREGIIYFPLYHPAAAFYVDKLKEMMLEDMRRLGELVREKTGDA